MCLIKNGIINFGLETETILKKKDLIISAAKNFRETAHMLMKKLENSYEVDFVSGKGIKELRILNEGINGVDEIDNEWRFNFHGYECLIWNTQTKQSLNIIFITRPEFGVLDPYFFLQYINTTPEWDQLKEFFKDEYDNVDQTLITLEAYGYFDRFLDDHFSSRGLIVK